MWSARDRDRGAAFAAFQARSRRHIIFPGFVGGASHAGQFDDKRVCLALAIIQAFAKKARTGHQTHPVSQELPLFRVSCGVIARPEDYIGILACVQTEINKALLYRLHYTRCTSLANSPSTVQFVRFVRSSNERVPSFLLSCACTLPTHRTYTHVHTQAKTGARKESQPLLPPPPEIATLFPLSRHQSAALACCYVATPRRPSFKPRAAGNYEAINNRMTHRE